MSISSELARINSNIARAYEVLQLKGATMPDVWNSENLAPTIESLVLKPSLSVTDDGNGNVVVSGVSITDDGNGNVTVSGVSASEENGNIILG